MKIIIFIIYTLISVNSIFAQNKSKEVILNLALDSFEVRIRIDNEKMMGALMIENKMAYYSILIDSSLFSLKECEKSGENQNPSYLNLTNVNFDDFSIKSQMYLLKPNNDYKFVFKFKEPNEFWNCFLNIYSGEFNDGDYLIKEIKYLNMNNLPNH